MHLAALAVLVATAADPGEKAMPPPTPPDGPPPVVRTAPAEPPRQKLLGAQLSAGVPQGFVLAITARPIPWARLHAGFAHNVLGPGIQGGVTLVPWRRGVSPTLTLDAGHFFETDVSGRFSGTFPSAFDPSLRKFGYDFVAAQLGVELGSQEGTLFFVRAGLAYLRSGLDGVSGYRPADSNATVDVSGLKLRATAPTLNLGVAVAVW